MPLESTIEAIQLRLNAFEAEKKVRECMNRYMYLCDILDEGFDLSLLMALFTADAVWEGKGQRYGKTFGQFQGRAAIAEMFSRYTKPPAHFDLNVHFLANELIDVTGGTATGSWVLLQPSTFATGKSQLSCARIRARFKCEEDQWLIEHFQTENLFSRPVQDRWNSSKPLPVPD